MTDSTVTMRDWWTRHYLTAARNAYPDLCANHKLAVGWKLTHPDGTTHAGYYWPLVNAEHDIPVAHVADNWNAHNSGSCPSRPGDGLCLVSSGANVVPASSGGVPLACSVGHVLVWPADIACSDEAGKWRAPWVVDVDCFRPLDLIRAGFMSADLSGADLSGADLSGANLSGANLTGANLSRADLYGATLTRAYGAPRSWPTNYNPTAAGWTA